MQSYTSEGTSNETVNVAQASEIYKSWEQVAGYFDGDGNVGVDVVKYVLRLKLRFSDTWRSQIETVRNFLVDNKIGSTEVYHEQHLEKKDAYRIDVGAISSVLNAARAMLPYCAKKAEDLRIVIGYLEGRMTGNQAIERLNHEVRIGRRSGYIRDTSLPYTRQEGLRIAQLENARNARAAYSVHVTSMTQESIIKDHRDLKLGYIRLSKKYGYSVSVIRRVLGKR